MMLHEDSAVAVPWHGQSFVVSSPLSAPKLPACLELDIMQLVP